MNLSKREEALVRKLCPGTTSYKQRPAKKKKRRKPGSFPESHAGLKVGRNIKISGVEKRR